MAVSDTDMLQSKQVDLDRIWADLKDGIGVVYRDIDKKLSTGYYADLYTLVYRFCTSERHGATNALTTSSKNDAGSLDWSPGQDLCKRLYKFLEGYLGSLLENRTDLKSIDMLPFYNEQWERYKSSSQVLNDIFLYFNQTWVKRQLNEGGKKVHDAYQLALVAWRDNFFAALCTGMTNAVLTLIEDDRNGKSIDAALVRAILCSYVELGLNEGESTAEGLGLSTYREAFEKAFLEATERFYSRNCVEVLSHNPVTEYMKIVEQHLSDEKRRVDSYLHETTLEPLTKTCENVLIAKQLGTFYAEFKVLLCDYNEEDIGRMFRLVSRTADGLSELRALFEEHVRQQGLLAVESLGDGVAQDPTLYVSTLLQVHRKYNALVVNAFGNDARFVHSFERACTKFTNSNAMTTAANSSKKSPAVLAMYSDNVLRSRFEDADESDLEENLNGVILLLKYTENKDVFLKFYRKWLAMRLVENLSVSVDAEAIMISKLSEACGFQYVRTFQRMLQDVSLSKDLSKEFRNHMENTDQSLDLDFGIQVLTFGSWPFQESLSMALPSELERSVQHFTVFYYARHNGRKLQWLYDVSCGELVTGCFRRCYTLRASALQMAILLRYNLALSFTVMELQEATGMDMDTLCKVLDTLINCKLLVCPGNESSPGTSAELSSGVVVSLSEDYSNEKTRVNINVPLKVEPDATEEDTYNRIEQDRKIVIQAAIVRIMKACKTLKHEDLLSKVVEQLSPRFIPEASEIEESIEILARKDFLQKPDGDPGTYDYVS